MVKKAYGGDTFVSADGEFQSFMAMSNQFFNLRRRKNLRKVIFHSQSHWHWTVWTPAA